MAAFVLCFALAGSTHIAAGFADKKAYNKGYRALRKGISHRLKRFSATCSARMRMTSKPVWV